MASFNRLSSPAQVYIQNLGATVSQTSDSAEVELKRTGRMKRAVQVVVSTEAPPPVSVPSLGSSKADVPTIPVLTPSLPLAVAGQDYTSIREVVTFAAGEESKTVTVPLIAGAAGPGERALPIYVTPASSGVLGTSGTLKLVDRADVTPPSIVGARLVSRRGGGGGIELTFSEPMDPSTVENPAHYLVTESTFRPNPLDVAVFLVSGSVGAHASAKVKITSATYDSADRTVTLVPARPLKASAQYAVANPPPRRSGWGRPVSLTDAAMLTGADALTDASGNPINGGGLASGLFSVRVDGTGRDASRASGSKAGRS